MSEHRKIHPNIARYPFRDFMRDVKEWRKYQDLASVCPEPEISKGLIRIPDKEQRGRTANMARISHMLSIHGHTGDDRVFRGVRFLAIMTCIAHCMKKIRKEFIALSDGIGTSTPPEVFAAFHEYFLSDDIPEKIDVDACIRRAREIEIAGILDSQK